MQQPLQKPLNCETRCFSCNKLIQKFTEDRSDIVSFVLFWFQPEINGKHEHICADCYAEERYKNGGNNNNS